MDSIVGTFIKHEWLRFSRSPRLTTQLGQTLLSAFFALYFVTIFLVLGFTTDKIVIAVMPDKDVLRVVIAGLFYYMLVDMMLRYFFQQFSTVSIEYYLIWPISKSKITRYLIARSWLSVFNLLPFLLIVPFIWGYASKNYNLLELFNFALIVIGLVMSSHLLIYLLNRTTGISKNWLLLIVSCFIGLLALDYYHVIPLFEFLFLTADLLISNSILSSTPIAIALILYIALDKAIRRLLVLEYGDTSMERRLFDPDIKLFSKYGVIGHLMNLELKLMTRSKRSRAFLMIGIFFFLYPIILNANRIEDEYILLGMGMLISGACTLNYGQLMLSWNSAHFDLLLTRSIHIEDIFKAKYYFLVVICIISFMVTLPYYFYNKELIYASATMFLANISINIMIYMLVASFNSKRIDIMAGAMMNYEGFTIFHYLIIIPMLSIPFAFFWIGETFISDQWGGYGLIVVICLMLLIMHERVIKFCVGIFLKNRYKIASNFRIKKS